MWVVRDKNGQLNIFFNKPVLFKNDGAYKDFPNSKIPITDKFTIESFEYITFGDEPKRVTLISYDSLYDIIDATLRKTKIPVAEQAEILADMMLHDFYLNY